MDKRLYSLVKPFFRRIIFSRFISLFTVFLPAAAVVFGIFSLFYLSGAVSAVILRYGAVISVSASFIAAAVFSMHPRGAGKRLYILDGMLGFKELLPSCHEALYQKNRYGQLLLELTEKRMDNVNKRRIPVNPFPLPLLIPVLFLFFLPFLPVTDDMSDSNDPWDGGYYQNLGKSLGESSPDDPVSMAYARQLEMLGRRIEEEELSKERTREEVDRLREDIRSHLQGLRKEREGGSEREGSSPRNESNGAGERESRELSLSGSPGPEGREAGPGTRKAEPEADIDDPESEGNEPPPPRPDNHQSGETDNDRQELEKAAEELDKALDRMAEEPSEQEDNRTNSQDRITEGEDPVQSPVQKKLESGEGEGGSGGEDDSGKVTSDTPGKESVEDKEGDPYEFLSGGTDVPLQLEGKVEEGRNVMGLLSRSLPEEESAEQSPGETETSYNKIREGAVKGDAVPDHLKALVAKYFTSISGKESQ
ncbi:MAG: hypothetical protein ACLFSE_00485 [Spirochaetia bacterium]